MPQDVCIDELRDLVAELELLQNILDVRGEPVQVCLEVRPELLRLRPGAQVAQRKWRDIVKRLSDDVLEHGFLVQDALLVAALLLGQDLTLCRLEHRVQTPDHGHGQDDVTVLAAHVNVAQDIVGDAPDKVGDPVEPRLIHEL